MPHISMREFIEEFPLTPGIIERTKVTAAQRAIYAALLSRFLLTDEERLETISSCHDLGTLQRWMIQAVTADTLDGFFAATG
ncbi:hypothetical protein [Nonomuraea sp. NPDC002799]